VAIRPVKLACIVDWKFESSSLHSRCLHSRQKVLYNMMTTSIVFKSIKTKKSKIKEIPKKAGLDFYKIDFVFHLFFKKITLFLIAISMHHAIFKIFLLFLNYF